MLLQRELVPQREVQLEVASLPSSPLGAVRRTQEQHKVALMLAPMRQRQGAVLAGQPLSNSLGHSELQEPHSCSRELLLVLARHFEAGRQCLTKGQRRVLSMGLGPLPEMRGLSETTDPVVVLVPVLVQAQVPGMPVFPEARLIILMKQSCQIGQRCCQASKP